MDTNKLGYYVKLKSEQLKEKLLEVPDVEDELKKVALFNYIQGATDTIEEIINLLKENESESDE
jgi:hypothetical protein